MLILYLIILIHLGPMYVNSKVPTVIYRLCTESWGPGSDSMCSSDQKSEKSSDQQAQLPCVFLNYPNCKITGLTLKLKRKSKLNLIMLDLW